IFFPYDPEHVFRFARVGQIAGIQIAREIDVLRIAGQAHHMAAQIGQMAAYGPAYALGRSGDEYAFVFHWVSSVEMMVRGTRGATAHSSSYPMVPAAAATSSTEGPPSPQSTAVDPTRAWGTASRSTASISMETRPTVTVRTPSTVIGVPDTACRG